MAEKIKRAFVIGWPIAHSLSPELHGFWLRQTQINGSYEKIAVPPEELEGFLIEMKNGQYVGGNITLPHKEQAYALLAKNNQHLEKLQAVNTLWLEQNVLHVANTDGYGFSANLDDFSTNWRQATCATVIGAGGAAKAIIDALVGAGIKKIVVVNRTRQRAQTLVDKFGTPCQIGDFSDLDTILKTTNLLVNTTSQGMKGQPPLEIDLQHLPKSAIVTDIVYSPLTTPLLAQANTLKLKTIDGIGMLMHQAVPGFEKWFGVRPTVSAELRTYMLEILSAGET